MIEDIPDSIQHIIIACLWLFFAFVIGSWRTEKRNKHESPDSFFYRLVKWNCIVISMLYAEAILLCSLAIELPDPDGLRTADEWLRQHNVLFWFLATCHQVLVAGMLLFELYGEVAVRRYCWLAIIPLFIQWCVGLFAEDIIGCAVVGIGFETITLAQMIFYFINIVAKKANVTRGFWGFIATSSYIVSALPILFLATRMKSLHHVIFLTIVFGFIHVSCMTRLAVLTNQPTTIIQLDTTVADEIVIESSIDK